MKLSLLSRGRYAVPAGSIYVLKETHKSSLARLGCQLVPARRPFFKTLGMWVSVTFTSVQLTNVNFGVLSMYQKAYGIIENPSTSARRSECRRRNG